MTKTGTDLRDLSKLVFNAQHRIAVALAVARSDAIVSYDEVAVASGASPSVVHKELALLVRIGAVGRVEAGRVVGFHRLESGFWAFVEELAARDSGSDAAER